MKIKYCLTYLIVMIFAFFSKANETSQSFEEGNLYYKEGSYYEAIESYETILQNGVANFETYYNLGNAYFKTGQVPLAIYYYEKALQLNPANEDAKHNLSFVNSLIAGDSKVVPQAFHIRFADAVMKIMSPDAWAVTGILLFVLTLVALAFFLLQTNIKLKRLLFYASFLGIILTISSWYFGSRMHKSITQSDYAIIMVASAGIKSSPDKSSADIYVANAGTKVKILSKLGDWFEVRVPDGNKGWIQIESLKQL